MANAAKKAPAKPAKGATKAAPAAPKAEKAAKAPKVERASANGITKPKDDSTTGRIWAIADEISAKKKAPATRAEVLERTNAEEINEATVATQYQRWRTYYGVPKAVAAPKPEKVAKAPAKKAVKKAATAPA